MSNTGEGSSVPPRTSSISSGMVGAHRGGAAPQGEVLEEQPHHIEPLLGRTVRHPDVPDCAAGPRHLDRHVHRRSRADAFEDVVGAASRHLDHLAGGLLAPAREQVGRPEGFGLHQPVVVVPTATMRSAPSRLAASTAQRPTAPSPMTTQVAPCLTPALTAA